MKRPPTIDSQEVTEFRSFAERAARAGGKILMDRMGNVRAIEKRPGDVVTQADRESQRAIRQLVQENFPHHGFIGEEDGQSSDDGSENREYCWIVDPLDGTVNFLHQLPSFAVSVALRAGDKIAAGAVFDPLLEECFTASFGQGATLNGRKITVGSCTKLAESLVACSLPRFVKPTDVEVARLLKVMCEGRATIRRLGSAALNLCYVACGRLDGYWATSVNAWDVAAGMLILQEAGGLVSHIGGGKFDLNDPRFVATSTSELHREIHPLLV